MPTAARVEMLSVQEWALIDDEIEGELVDGLLVEEEMPDAVHETIVGFILALLRTWIVPRGGLVLGSEYKYAVSARRGRKPDVSAYFPGVPRPGGRDKISKIPPTLVVEVITDTPRDTRRDRVEKSIEYAAFGVRFYWIVDPEARTLEIFERLSPTRRERSSWTQRIAVTEGRVRVPGCRGLVLDLDRMWREVDAVLAD